MMDQVDAFIRAHAACPGLNLKDPVPDDLTEDATGIRVLLFCTTCGCDLRVVLPASDLAARAEDGGRRGSATVLLERVREILRLDQSN